MKRAGSVMGLLILFGIGYYVYSMWRQSKEIEELCASYFVGAEAENMRNTSLEFGVQLMGPYEIEKQPGVQKFIFCAPLSMCDVSCALEVKDGVVTSSDYVSR